MRIGLHFEQLTDRLNEALVVLVAHTLDVLLVTSDSGREALEERVLFLTFVQGSEGMEEGEERKGVWEREGGGGRKREGGREEGSGGSWK